MKNEKDMNKSEVLELICDVPGCSVLGEIQSLCFLHRQTGEKLTVPVILCKEHKDKELVARLALNSKTDALEQGHLEIKLS